MNWKLIAETCPKAWKEFCKLTHHIDGGQSAWEISRFQTLRSVALNDYRTPITYYTRDLYDHFDALGLHCLISISGVNRNLDYLWSWEVHGKGIKEFKDRFATRTEAESAAFTRAFALREAQITNQQ